MQWNDTSKDISPFKCRLFFHALEFMAARQTCHRVVWTPIWSIPYSRERCNKNCIVKTSEPLIIWSASCYTAEFDKSDATGVPDRSLKRAAMVFRVHSIDTLNSCWPTGVHSQPWLSIFGELCAIVEKHAWYFRCIIVSLKLCKECFEYGDIQNTILIPDKELNILIYRTPSYVITYRSYTLLNIFRFCPPYTSYTLSVFYVFNHVSSSLIRTVRPDGVDAGLTLLL